MKILAIDTSTEACSAALSINGSIEVLFEIAPQQHSQLILQQCDSLLADAGLKPAQLDAIAFGRGPGSFTGLRIAAGVTQGIAFGCNLPVIGISTLAAQAQQVCSQYPNHTFLSTIDARMKEIYWGTYTLSDTNTLIIKDPETVGSANTITLQDTDKIIGLGSGWKVYEPDLSAHLATHQISEIFPDTLPSAKEVAILACEELIKGNALPADQAIPVYLRNNIAKKTKAR